ncbi:MAG: malate dehydrogenase [Deltaproteobacteria bacterium]|nr:malate dehydrogenase [Deltaproteobacteria bacterium]
MARKKITVVGAGRVGESTAALLAEKEVGDVVVVDVVPNMPQGKTLDLMQARPVYKSDVNVVGSNGYDETKNSDVIVITSGMPRKPGMSREDLLTTNVKIVQSVTDNVAKRSPNAIIIVVANPVDGMTYVSYKVSKFPRERVMGMAGVLDSARFRTFIAMELNVSVEDVSAFVIGVHGDEMVPSVRYTNVAGIPVAELIAKDKLDAIVARTRKAGGEIVNLLGFSAYYAPAASAVEMVEAILKDKKKILPAITLCNGEFGLKDVFMGVPVKLGEKGIEKIFEIKMSEEEAAALKKSAEAVNRQKNEIDGLKLL